jgi:hypothetical protein
MRRALQHALANRDAALLQCAADQQIDGWPDDRIW